METQAPNTSNQSQIVDDSLGLYEPYKYLLYNENIAKQKKDEEESKNNILKISSQLGIFSRKDDYRIPTAHKKGGNACLDEKTLKTLRSIGTEMIKNIGRKIFSGDFNLTTISFPIKCMRPISMLHAFINSVSLNPLFMNKAAMLTDPVERMKYIICSFIGTFVYTTNFLKPLNPVLGETYNATFEDGTLFYAEQTSHRPPISHYMIYGPNKLYNMNGYAIFSSGLHLNKLEVKCAGNKHICFQDGSHITYTLPEEWFYSTLIGTLRHLTLGTVKFYDKKNEIEVQLTFGNVKNFPKDYISGKIMMKGNQVSSIFGTYLGYLEFDNKRYWDARDVKPSQYKPNNDTLPSDATFRNDLQMLLAEDYNEGQKSKEEIEKLQRYDRGLREAYTKTLSKSNKIANKT